MTTEPISAHAERRRVTTLCRISLIMLILVAACACSLPGMRRADEQSRLPVRSIDPLVRRLEIADAASAHLHLGEIGRSGPAGMELPAWRVAYRPFEAGLKRILVIAGVRGNEPAGPEAALQLVEDLTRPPDGAAICDMDIIPLVNPWGWIHDRPSGRAGVEIDADFASFDSPEARVIRRFLREKRYDLVIELREDEQARGFGIWQYGSGDRNAADRITQAMRAKGFPIEPDSGRIFFKTRDGVVEAPSWGLTAMRLTRRLSLAGYLRQNVAQLVFSARAPASLPLPERVAMLRLALDGLISEYGTKR